MRIPAAAIFKNRSLLRNKADSDEKRLSLIHPSMRILLISHCLRSSKGCRAEIEAWGLQCVECNPSCQVNRLRKTALEFGYKGVCVAPGGSLAMKFVRASKPEGIVAVACSKELAEGIENVKKMIEEKGVPAPPVVIIPLTKDGCVDTEVNIDVAIAKISLGCSLGIKTGT